MTRASKDTPAIPSGRAASANLFDTIARSLDQLRPSERKVASVVLADPEAAVGLTLSMLAERSAVSEPTIVRFCRSLGCEGYHQFRMELARSLGGGEPYLHKAVAFDDDVGTQIEKVLGFAQWALTTLRARLDQAAVESAIKILAKARRLEFHGSGASGIVALDAQNKFFRLDVPAAAYSDPHQQLIAAAALAEGDALVIFSHTGRTRDLITAANVARERKAQVIAVTRQNSPLARNSDIVIAVPVVEDPDQYTPMASRIAQLLIVDILAIGVAMQRGPEFVAHLKRLHDNLASLRVSK
jgi:RpiR family carbohydrate utilization transcriptional regulator